MRVDYFSYLEASIDCAGHTKSEVVRLDCLIDLDFYYFDIVTSEEDKDVFGVDTPDLIKVIVRKSNNSITLFFPNEYSPPSALVELVSDLCRSYAKKYDSRFPQIPNRQYLGKYGYRSISNIYINSIETYMTAIELTILDRTELDLIPRSSWVKNLNLLRINNGTLRFNQEHQSESYDFGNCLSILVESPYRSIYEVGVHKSSITWSGTKNFYRMTLKDSYFTIMDSLHCHTLSLVNSNLSSLKSAYCTNLHIQFYAKLETKVTTKNAKLDRITITPDLLDKLNVSKVLTLIGCDFLGITELTRYEEIFITDDRVIFTLSAISFTGSYVTINRSNIIVKGNQPSKSSINDCSFLILDIQDKIISLHYNVIDKLTVSRCNELYIDKLSTNELDLDSISAHLSNITTNQDNSSISIKSFKKLSIRDSELKFVDLNSEGRIDLSDTKIYSLNLSMHNSNIKLQNCSVLNLIIESSNSRNMLKFDSCEHIHRLQLSQCSLIELTIDGTLEVDSIVLNHYVNIDIIIGKLIVLDRIIIASTNPSSIDWNLIENLVKNSIKSTKILINKLTYRSFSRRFDSLDREVIVMSMTDIRKEF